jgi:phage-related protein
MKGGFSYCGVDIADIGMNYAPELENTYVYRPAKAEVHEEVFESHHGGYYYGATIQPKEFKLRLYFEDTIDRGLMAKFYSLFKVGKCGQLIFKRRPWCYYNATVTEIDDSGLMTYRSGTITVSMKAYYPFSRCDDFYCQRSGPDYDYITQNTALLENEDMVPSRSIEFSITSETGGEKSIILANPGSERAPVCVSVSGNVGNGVDIVNKTTGQMCSIINLIDSSTGTVMIDSLNGMVSLTKNGTSKPAFLYHDKGFLELDPSFPAKRNVYIESSSGNKVRTASIVDESAIGQYIYLGDKTWGKIATVSNRYDITLETPVTVVSSSLKSMIMPMNEITLRTTSAANVSITFNYKPTFA